MVKQAKNLLKVAGALAALPGVVDAVQGVVKEGAPLVKEALARMHEENRRKVTLPDLRDMSLEQAQEYLESIGLQSVGIRAKARKEYATALKGEVVSTLPKGGIVAPEIIVKLYYVDEAVMDESKELAETRKVQKPAGFQFPKRPF